MPISTPNFTATESLATLENVTFTDISVGSDLNLTSRRIYCRLANGKYLTTGGVESDTEAYTTWAIADAATTISLLTQSTVANVRVDWMAGTAVAYTKTILTIWNLYDYIFSFGLIQSQTATPTIINDVSYYSKFFEFITNIWSSESAVTYGNDLYSSASCLSKNQFLITNANDYF
jgi:hypothetical protein